MNARCVFAALSAAWLALTACAHEEAAPAPEPVAESPAPVQVMVLGVYHFDNPGLDLNNIETDNVLSQARQRELAALADALLTFEPTAVAVERSAPPPYDDPDYADFTRQALAEESSEDAQIGYRVASLAGLDTVYAINEQPSDGEPDYFPYGPVAQFAEETGRAGELEAIADISGLIAEFETLQKTHSIPYLLKLHNTGFIPNDFYWDIIKFGEGETQPGAELAAYWFMRNARIFNKLVQVTEPGDRIIVVFGAGHGAWLRELVTRTHGYELVDPVPYLDAAEAALAAE